MDKVFRFLTRQDTELMLEKAERLHYSRNQVILEEGSRKQAIYIIRKGLVRIERSHLGQGIAIAHRREGDLLGEVSFLDENTASASVIAEEDVEVDVIRGQDVYCLLSSVPGFSSRFYQSLSFILSQRLREASSLLPPLMVEEVPQVKRFHSQRTGHVGSEQIPPKLVSDVERFKMSMLEIHSTIKGEGNNDGEIQEGIDQSCDEIRDSLRTHIRQEGHLGEGIGAFVFRETFPFFMLSSLFDRSYAKPRGYAGDYYTIEMIYQNEPRGDGRLGDYIDSWALRLSPTRAVQNRRPLLTGLVKEAAGEWRQPDPMPVTSLASGPARELFDLFVDEERPNIHATCVDIDNEALTYASEMAHNLELTDKMSFVKDNIVRMARGRGRTILQPQRIIYSTGLIDYFQDGSVIALLDWVYDNLLPGGRVVLGNFDTSNPDKEFMDHILEWVLIHRSPEQLEELFARSRFGDSPVRIIRDDTGVQLLAISER
jgi:extracellular factor (EF) 3-hydroxypalmitic acid methyl ester biosynthesis protein